MLGAAAAGRLGIDRIYPGERIWVGGQWFYLAGILNPAVLAPEIDTAVLVGFPAAENYLGFDGHPSQIYLRARHRPGRRRHASSPPPPTPKTPTRSPSASPPTRSSPGPTPKAR